MKYDHVWEEQFKNPEKVPLCGEKVMRIVDLKPENPGPVVPIIFLYAWATTVDVYKSNIKEIASDNKRTIAIDQPHGIGIENLSEEERISAAEHFIPETQFFKIVALLKTIMDKELDQVNIVAHSEGAIIGAYAAILKPKKFRNMVLINPGGMIGKSSPGHLIRRTLLDVALQTWRIFKDLCKEGGYDTFKKLLVGGREIVKTFMSNPGQTSIAIREAAESQIHEILQTLRELGIKISIIHGVDDKLYPMARVQEHVNAKSVDGFYSIQSAHTELSMYPKKFSKVINQALDSLEALRGKERGHGG